MPDHVLESGDTPDLEALFDSIAQQHQADTPEITSDAGSATASHITAEGSPSVMYEQIGQLTRKLHSALRDMGYDKSLERVANAIPDARDRLSYISTLTESAAERVLNATDIAKPIQDELESSAKQLSERWNRLFANMLSVDEFRQLSQDTHRYLQSVPKQTQATSAQLLDIVMAQDFQDLTGQVIKKMMGMVKTIETDLVAFLIEFSPEEKKTEIDPTLLNGPVINPEGRSDVVTNQQQVDDLLESLGF
nr:protein phosphatase CheZ [uncultured Pseudogulbenkiania sp.]